MLQQQLPTWGRALTGWDAQSRHVPIFLTLSENHLSLGFDLHALDLQGEGDTVEARILEGQPGKVVIEEIVGDGGRLRKEPEENCCGIAALETLAMLPGGTPSCGVSLRLHKGLPLGSGMGSSAASAAAACWAVNNLFGNVLSKEDLVLAGLKSEAKVSGYHADNIAPALMGGFVLIRYDSYISACLRKWLHA